VAGPLIRYGGIIAGHEEILAVNEVLLGQAWTGGPKTLEFEKKAARWQGRDHALFVNSGSSALLLAMTLLPPGSRVAMPALQFPTLYSTAKWCGHIPVLVDVDDSLNMDPEALEAARHRHAHRDIDAVAFVHMAGNPANITEVSRYCQEHRLPLIEDICEAFGSTAAGVKAGNSGLVSAASTHGAHHICTGQGGLVFTDDEDAYQKMRRIRDWGRAYGTADIPGYYPGYVFSELGLNLQASDIQAALGVVQLGRADGFIARRRENWLALHAAISDLPLRVPDVREGHEPSWFAFPMLVPEKASRAAFITHLEAAGVECRTVVAGNMARQPICDDDPEAYPVADKWFQRGLWVSTHPRISPEDVAYLAKVIREYW
jgi:CDP-4-dehydro-6-deoxyglucose reductase, E1